MRQGARERPRERARSAAGDRNDLWALDPAQGPVACRWSPVNISAGAAPSPRHAMGLAAAGADVYMFGGVGQDGAALLPPPPPKRGAVRLSGAPDSRQGQVGVGFRSFRAPRKE